MFRLSHSRAFCFILLLGLLGCGSDSGTSTVTRTPPPPRGVVQSRTLADGTTHIAIGVAPHGPNFRTPDLSELRGQGIFDIVDKANGVRGRLKNDRTGLDALAGGQAVYVTDWLMRTEGRGIELFGGENSGDRTNLDPARPLFGGFSSDGYLVYNAHLTTDEQAIAVTNGTIVGRADIRRTNIPHPNFPDSEIGLIEVSHNEGPFQPIIQDRPTASPNKYILSVVLPMESGSDPAGLGTWTVDAEPPIRLDPVNEPDNIVGGTPFSWHIRGLVIEDITVENKPNYVDPETGEEFHGGSIYTAKARMGPTAEPPEESLGAYNPTGRFYYRVKVLAGPAQYQVPILVDGGDFDPSGTELSFEWNGVNSGQRFPAGEKYPVSIWGVIDANGLSEPGDPNENPILTASGRVATPQNFVGPPELVPPRAYFTVFPSPYIPAPLDIDGDPLWFKFGDEYEPLWTHPETGDPWWPVVGMNDDGEVEYAFHPTVWEDGVEKEVDEDGDGFPDIGPQRPEPMKISGEMLFDPKKQELDEPWTIHVRKEAGGEDVHPVFTGDTNVIDKEISYEDMVRIVQEEGVNELHFEFHMKLCDLGQRELFFTARALEPNALPTPSGQCLLPIEFGVVAGVGGPPLILDIFDGDSDPGGDSDPNSPNRIGTSDEIRRAQLLSKVYDVKSLRVRLRKLGGGEIGSTEFMRVRAINGRQFPFDLSRDSNDDSLVATRTLQGLIEPGNKSVCVIDNTPSSTDAEEIAASFATLGYKKQGLLLRETKRHAEVIKDQDIDEVEITTPDFVKWGGYQTLIVEPQNGPGPKAYVRVRSRAEVICYIGENGLLLQEELKDVAGQFLSPPTEWAGAGAVLHFRNSVININGYGGLGGIPQTIQDWGPTPGAIWRAAVPSPSNLLGSRVWNPDTGSSPKSVVQRFVQEAATSGSSSVIWAKPWMMASIDFDPTLATAAVDLNDRYWFWEFNRGRQRIRDWLPQSSTITKKKIRFLDEQGVYLDRIRLVTVDKAYWARGPFQADRDHKKSLQSIIPKRRRVNDAP